MVRLDERGDAVLTATRLDDVRVERALDEEADVAKLASLLLEDADELLADDLALLLRIGDAASRVRKRFCACTWTSGTWKWPPNVSTTCSASFSRRSPWSTKTHVSWSPTALCTRSAATAESTPPESAQSTRSEPTAARIRATCSSMTAAGVQVGGVPATS